ncbi:MAG TPA: SusC/RagA family TonB-linked outer membrane protein [Chitinophagaceae bacterium]|jgi:TonB-linked SusC/RagA family outer membrane protein|nr:SusC/RagA family TonB-linked outer membrane protein [Chitinophagaceae bacterium]
MSKINCLLIIPLLFLGTLSSAQDRTVTGKVVNLKDNLGVAGASISVKGRTTGTSTGGDGSFSIVVPAGKVTLQVSSVGFTTVEHAVAANENNIVIQLAEGATELTEVVVTALGIQRQAKTLVYATQSVKPSELTEIRDPNNVLNQLQGKVANAVVTQGSGGPGSGARIVLRGNRSIQQSNNALIVVDGVPMNNTTEGTGTSDFGSIQGSDGASNINPDDIESITVLRGASAAALYGSQAGNGVIVITTKKGAKDRVSVIVNSGIGFEKAWSLPEVQNQYGQGNGGVFTDTLTSGESWGAKMDGRSYVNFLGQQRSYTAQPDNIKDFFRTGISSMTSIGVSGGSDKMQTYLSYTYTSTQGIIPFNDLARHNVNLRINNQIGSRFSTDAKVTYVRQDIKDRPRTGEENSPTIDIYQTPRNISTDDAKQYEFSNNVGLPTPTPFPLSLSSIYQNPYWMINRTHINQTRDRIIGLLSAKVKLTDWLSVSGRVNLDKTMDNDENQVSQGTTLWGKSGGDYQKQNIYITEKWFDAMVEGVNSITKDLKINYRAGAIYQDNKFDATYSAANGLNIANKFSMNFAKSPSVNSSFTQVQTQSVYGQINLSFKDAIFLDASLRHDWDSRLPAPHDFSYPSIGASVVISDLVTLPKSMSYLKASVNYAEVGNGGQPKLLTTVYNYSQGAGNGFLQRSSTLPIPGLKPEIVKNIEGGIEARFLNNRVGFMATYYKSNSFNQLLTIQLPPATGYATQYINAGNIQNQGFELVANGFPVRNKDFSWEVALNFATNDNKIKELSDEIKETPLGGGFGRSATPIVKEGGSYGDLVGQTWARDAKGNLMVTAAGKPAINTDPTLLGNFNPKQTIGLTNTINYKAFSFRLLIDGRLGGIIMSGTEMNLAFSGIPEATGQYREGGWSLGGVDANGNPVSATISAQDFWQIASGKRYGVAEFFTYHASNIRAREASIGYDIPVKSISFLSFVKGIKISAVARNLFWIYRGSSTLDIPGLGTRKMWFDPDMSLGNANWQGVEYGTLPSTRSWGFNLKFTF